MSSIMEQALAKRVKGLGEPEALPIGAIPADVLEGVRKALLAGETHYTDRPGMPALREHVAMKLGRTKEEVIITSGESEARFVARLALGEVSDELLFGTWDELPGITSFRVGYVVAPLDVAKKVRSLKQALSICTAAPSQRAVLVALER